MSAPLSPRSRRAQSFDQTTHQASDAHAPPTIPELIRSKSSEEVWIDVAETGDCFCAYVVNRHTTDAQDAFSHFTQQLERGSGIPRASLIVLAGPPFKSYSRGVPPQGVSKVYLYDKRCLGRAAQAADVTSSQGLFANALLSRPLLPSEPAEVVDDELQRLSEPKALATLPPLLRLLPTYERCSMLCLNKGQHYLSEALRRKQLCEAWFLARQRQRAALAAAVGNLLDHFGGAAREYRKVASQLSEQQARSLQLLRGFDQALDVIRNTPLHPALVPLLNAPTDSSSSSYSTTAAASATARLTPEAGTEAAAATSSSESRPASTAATSASSEGGRAAGSEEGSATRRGGEREKKGAESTASATAAATSTHGVVTLADLVPTDKYGPYVAQCTLSAQRLQQSSAELDALFSRLDAGVAMQQQVLHSETDGSGAGGATAGGGAKSGGGAKDGSKSVDFVAAGVGTATSRASEEERTREEVEGTLGQTNALAVAGDSSGASDALVVNSGSAPAAEALAVGSSSSSTLSSTSSSAAVGPSSQRVVAEYFEEGQPFVVELAHLEQQVATVKDLARLQSALAAKVERDYGDARAAVVNQLKEALEPSAPASGNSPASPGVSGSSMQGSVLVQSAVEELELMRCRAEADDLPKLAAQDASQLEAAQRIAQRLEAGARDMRQRLAQVSQLQRSIVNLQQHVKLRAEALRQQRDDFVHLEAVHKLPQAYASFLAEVQRRSLAAQHADKLTAACDAQLAAAYATEVGHRERFLARHGPYLPPPFAQVLVPSLFQKPPRVRLEKSGVPPQLPDLSLVPPPRLKALQSAAATSDATAKGIVTSEIAGVAESGGTRGADGGSVYGIGPEEEEEEEEETLLVEADEDEAGLEDPALEVLQLRAKCAALEVELAHAQRQLQQEQQHQTQKTQSGLQQPQSAPAAATATATHASTLTTRDVAAAAAATSADSAPPVSAPPVLEPSSDTASATGAGASVDLDIAESSVANPTGLVSPQSAVFTAAERPQKANHGESLAGGMSAGAAAAMRELSRWAQVLEAQLNQPPPPEEEEEFQSAENAGAGGGGSVVDSGTDHTAAAAPSSTKKTLPTNTDESSAGNATAVAPSNTADAASAFLERLAVLLERASTRLASKAELAASPSSLLLQAASTVADEEEAVISFRKFRPGNLVLFLPVYPKKTAAPPSPATAASASGSSSSSSDAPGLVYLAFNEARPRHYLSQESAAFFRARNAGKPPHFIVGRVIVIDSLVAGPRGSNPFDLAEGAAYHVITVESI